jgi:hypothetical protein
MHPKLGERGLYTLIGELYTVTRDTYPIAIEIISTGDRFTLNEFDYIRWCMPYLDQLDETGRLETKPCSHTWKPYIGLTETFSYCTKCDTKDFKDA